MAVTKGHGNPDWTRDETILALDLYFHCDRIAPGRADPRVKELSDLLRTIPLSPDVKRNDRFRNPDGVRFKLQNLWSVETMRGLKNISAMDRTIMAQFVNKPELIQKMATAIRLALKIDAEGLKKPYFEEDTEFSEGRILTEVHRRRERHPGLRRALLAKRRKSGQLRCEICEMELLSRESSIS
jgi:5-methylcytosine-specific restriction protein A